MKDSADTHEANPQSDDSSAFQRFAKAMRALVAVPKREVDEKIAADKVKRAKSRKAG
jgi:hypothetical protein